MKRIGAASFEGVTPSWDSDQRAADGSRLRLVRVPGAASTLLRLRIIRPAVAVFVGAYLIVLAVYTLVTPAPGSAKRMAVVLGCLVLLQFCLGIMNVLLLTPLWAQVLHLPTADLIWITLVLLAHVMLEKRVVTIADRPPDVSHALDASVSVERPAAEHKLPR